MSKWVHICVCVCVFHSVLGCTLSTQCCTDTSFRVSDTLFLIVFDKICKCHIYSCVLSELGPTLKVCSIVCLSYRVDDYRRLSNPKAFFMAFLEPIPARWSLPELVESQSQSVPCFSSAKVVETLNACKRVLMIEHQWVSSMRGCAAVCRCIHVHAFMSACEFICVWVCIYVCVSQCRSDRLVVTRGQ